MALNPFRSPRVPTVLVGICRVCQFRGVIRPKTVVTDTYVSSISEEDEDIYTNQLVCVTCFETPSGCRSENLGHERLPAAEYK